MYIFRFFARVNNNMEFRSYNAELADANLMFKSIFSNISIVKATSRNENDLVLVKCMFGQRSRILKSLQNDTKKGMLKFPLILINRTGYSRAPERLNNLNNEVKYEYTSKKRQYELYTPIPININYEVIVMSKSPSDIDQIASNFMIFMNNDKYMSCMHPKYNDIKFNCQVIMEDSVSEEHSGEIDESTDDIISSTFNFTFKTYLFAGTERATPLPADKTKVLSSYVTQELKDVVVELKPDEIDEFQRLHPEACLSATQKLCVDVTHVEYVDNPDLSDVIYDGFVPLIHKIHSGFYAIPRISTDYIQAMVDIDNYPEPDRFRDVLIWKI